MKETKVQKGITLIALIITIIVLLILAVVAINAITGDGILTQARRARYEYGSKQDEEINKLKEYELFMAQQTGSAWVQNVEGRTVTFTKGKTTVKAGDYVNYVSGVSGYNDTNGWRVLGVEAGKLLLVSTNNVNDNCTLSGLNDFINIENELNEICEPFGEREGATGARSIKVEDINKLTGYNPENTGLEHNGGKYYEGDLDEYGNDVIYSMNAQDL